MKKLLLLSLTILLFSCGDNDDSNSDSTQNFLEKYKVYNTTNIYTSLLLDSATGRICKLQEKNNKLKRSSVDTQLKNIAVGALGLFAGFSLKS